MASNGTSAAAAAAPGAGKEITEDEASLYDRQIRLWGLSAQTLLRQSRILLINLTGPSSEIAKNLVLAGIGSLTVLDGARVTPALLGSSAGILLREGEGAVGANAAEAALEPLRMLNPLVELRAVGKGLPGSVDPWSEGEGERLGEEELDQLLEGADCVVVCDKVGEVLGRLAERVRKVKGGAGKKFFACGAMSLGGWAFVDCGEAFEYAVDKAAPTKENPTATKKLRYRASYPTLPAALAHSWAGKGVKERERRRAREAWRGAWVPQAVWKFRAAHEGKWPVSEADGEELWTILKQLLTTSGLLPSPTPLPFSKEDIIALLPTLPHSLPPQHALLGGLVVQDVLHALSGRGAGAAGLWNWFAYDAVSGWGEGWRAGMEAPAVVKEKGEEVK